jgi:hypothetical protein
MPPVKPIRAALVVALALCAVSHSLVPASGQVFRPRKDVAKKECADKHGTWADESSGGYSCTYPKERKILKCDKSDKCSTSDMPAPKPAAAAPAKSLAGTGDRSESGLKEICAKNKAWMFTVEKSGAYSCVDSDAGIAINCTAKGRCTEAHTPVRAR